MIACVCPGKMGDALYCIPAVKELCRINGCNADFYIPTPFNGVAPILRYQSFINEVISPQGSRIMLPHEYHLLFNAIPGSYDNTYRLHFKNWPNTFLPDFICMECGFNPLPLELEYPDVETHGWYLTYDAKAKASFPFLFECIEECIGLRMVDVGSIGVSVVNAPSIIAKSKGFIGVPSFPLAVASFLKNVKRVALVAPGFQTSHLSSTKNDLTAVMYEDSERHLESIVKFLAE